MIFILYPHQLFRDFSNFADKKVLLVEEPLFFTQYTFHIQKLVLHRASMKFYEDTLRQNNIDVVYFEDESYLELYKDKAISIYDVADDYLHKKIVNNFSRVHVLKSPNFLNVEDTTNFFHSFYINRRKELNILLDEKRAPIGGKWSFDAQNRKKLPKDEKVPVDIAFENKYTDEAKKYCKKFKSAGEIEDIYFATTYIEAKIVFEYFLEKKFAKFGEYQDAITKKDSFLYHSNISSALNIGLLDIEYVIGRVLSCDTIALNAKEGFIRQVIGWREFMHQTYKKSGSQMRNANFFDCKNDMPQKILEASSGLTPLDEVVKKVDKTSYAHHIERLMVLGNIFLLLEIKPDDVHAYFMANFIDAYDWVMVGNVYGMSGFSDGGSITTKPYIASSNYIRKMSDYKKGPWCEILDGLYWSFMKKHSSKFADNPRMKMQIVLLEKMDEAKLSKHLQIAREFKESLGMYAYVEDDMSRLVEMAWQDRTPFESIEKLYGMSENRVIKMMRKLMSKSSFTMWRKRMHGRKTKHLKKLEHKPTRFQGPW